MIRALTINIGAASRERADRLARWLANRQEEVFLLTETSAGPGTAHLLERFRSAGYAVVKTPDADGERGAALISRVPLLAQPADLAQVSIPCRVAVAALDTVPRIWIAAMYVPSRDRSADKTARKQRFIASLLHALGQVPDEQRHHMVVGGDYNVIGTNHQPAHSGFLPFEYGLLDGLAAMGFTDAHQHCTPGVQAHSWIGRTGDGYRYDYLHVGTALTGRIRRCVYLHETREQQLSDHAALTLDLDVKAALLPYGELETAEPIELF